jgi:Ca2+-binding RTX toxin-like protein
MAGWTRSTAVQVMITLYGGEGPDVIDGGAGDDVIFGDASGTAMNGTGSVDRWCW